jgi:uncharacterized C2H2 Zn-finger protein
MMLMQAPIRLCCGQRHYSTRCPDGQVMCCLCFDRFNISELATEDDHPIDICKPCYEKDQKMYIEIWECPECGELAKFTRPRMHVEHDCRGRKFDQPKHTVKLIKREEEMVNE